MKNIELKVKTKNFSDIVRALENAGGVYKGTLVQKDIYYNCRDGRLKFRQINVKTFQLIYYQRPNLNSSRESEYRILKLTKRQAESAKLVFKLAFGETVIVDKVRRLWRWRHTRVHLDTVKNLGRFIELETEVRSIGLKRARLEHEMAVEILKLGGKEKYPGSYSDMVRV